MIVIMYRVWQINGIGGMHVCGVSRANTLSPDVSMLMKDKMD
jgi:hypothetical protein